MASSRVFNQFIGDRLREIEQIASSSDWRLVGKAQRISGPQGEGGNYITHGTRFSGGFGREVPELSGASPAQVARSLRSGKGKVFRRIVRAVRSYYRRHAGTKGLEFLEPKKREAVPPVGPHESMSMTCTKCGVLHKKADHRFHGPGAFGRTHMPAWVKNPRAYYVAIWGPGRWESRAFMHKLAAERFVRRHKLIAKIERWGGPAAPVKNMAGRGRGLTRKHQPSTHKRGTVKYGSVRRAKKIQSQLRRWEKEKPDPFADSRKLFGLNPHGASTKSNTRTRTSTSTEALTTGNTTLTITGSRNVVRIPKGRNPPGVIIYHRLLKIEARKGPNHRCDAGCKRANHSYFHDFGVGAVVYGMPDGSLVIRNVQGKRLWKYF